MARFNEILAGRYNRMLQKLFQLKGGPPAAQLASEVMPIFPLFCGRENRYLEGWQSYGVARFVVAVAAVVGGMRLRNPANSNLVAVFEKITFGAAAADQPTLSLGPTAADLITPFTVNPMRLDARGSPVSSLIMSDTSGGVSAGFLPAKVQVFIPANSSYDFVGTDVAEIPLLPGDAIQVASNIANQGAAIAFIWRERSLEDSETK